MLAPAMEERMPNEVAIAARCEIEVRDIEYRLDGDAPLLARLYRPIGDGPFPALVAGAIWWPGSAPRVAPTNCCSAC